MTVTTYQTVTIPAEQLGSPVMLVDPHFSQRVRSPPARPWRTLTLEALQAQGLNTGIAVSRKQQCVKEHQLKIITD